MVTKIDNDETNASGEPSAGSKGIPNDQKKKLHDDDSVRKVFYFKYNHCGGKIKNSFFLSHLMF